MINVYQWWSVPFQMRKDTLFMDVALFLLQHWLSWLIHIPFTQLNVTVIGLGYYMTLEFSLNPSWSCYNLAYEWKFTMKVHTGWETNLMWQTVTHGQTVTFNTALHTLACIQLTVGVIISPTIANGSFYWTNSGMFIPVCLFKKRFSTKSAEWIHPWSGVNTAHSFIAAMLYSFSQSTLCALLLSPLPFNAQDLCSCMWKIFPSQTATHSLHRCHYIS
jgi:hypothetical protein